MCTTACDRTTLFSIFDIAREMTNVQLLCLDHRGANSSAGPDGYAQKTPWLQTSPRFCGTVDDIFFYIVAALAGGDSATGAEAATGPPASTACEWGRVGRRNATVLFRATHDASLDRLFECLLQKITAYGAQILLSRTSTSTVTTTTATTTTTTTPYVPGHCNGVPEDTNCGSVYDQEECTELAVQQSCQTMCRLCVPTTTTTTTTTATTTTTTTTTTTNTTTTTTTATTTTTTVTTFTTTTTTITTTTLTSTTTTTTTVPTCNGVLELDQCTEDFKFLCNGMGANVKMLDRQTKTVREACPLLCNTCNHSTTTSTTTSSLTVSTTSSSTSSFASTTSTTTSTSSSTSATTTLPCSDFRFVSQGKVAKATGFFASANVSKVLSKELCEARCRDNTNCVSYSYLTNGNWSRCHTSPDPPDAVKNSTAIQQQFDTYTRADLVLLGAGKVRAWDALDNATTKAATECAELCRGNAACVSYSYRLTTGQCLTSARDFLDIMNLTKSHRTWKFYQHACRSSASSTTTTTLATTSGRRRRALVATTSGQYYTDADLAGLQEGFAACFSRADGISRKRIPTAAPTTPSAAPTKPVQTVGPISATQRGASTTAAPASVALTQILMAPLSGTDASVTVAAVEMSGVAKVPFLAAEDVGVRDKQVFRTAGVAKRTSMMVASLHDKIVMDFRSSEAVLGVLRMTGRLARSDSAAPAAGGRRRSAGLGLGSSCPSSWSADIALAFARRAVASSTVPYATLTHMITSCDAPSSTVELEVGMAFEDTSGTSAGGTRALADAAQSLRGGSGSGGLVVALATPGNASHKPASFSATMGTVVESRVSRAELNTCVKSIVEEAAGDVTMSWCDFYNLGAAARDRPTSQAGPSPSTAESSSASNEDFPDGLKWALVGLGCAAVCILFVLCGWCLCKHSFNRVGTVANGELSI